jgi:nucleoid-associated protein YgaU|tara:strand:+ start:235 stop:579 length:345 start_codon:yes stop_codon:yes gene_type:complete
MAYRRYTDRDIIANDDEQYRRQFYKSKDLRVLSHYETAEMVYPTPEEIQELDIVTVTWSTGTRLFKLANQFYGDPNLWWVIGFFNQKPTDAHYKIGDVISIPTPIERVLRIIKV